MIKVKLVRSLIGSKKDQIATALSVFAKSETRLLSRTIRRLKVR